MIALKLVLTPLLIGMASVAGRRWGPVVSGWLIGLPLTSAPVVLFLAGATPSCQRPDAQNCRRKAIASYKG